MSADMTDRELLELAARAAGLVLDEWTGADGTLDWNPLHDDGDALRLAVKLNLCINFDVQPDGAEVYVVAEWTDNPTEAEPLGRDASAATRRAIVRAAAAIGSAA